ncbi:MAG: hypothetical protein IJ325_05430 [Clostridia bacterium]|nr:hypothetical protein [Clostridia bacterium]
MQDNEKFCAQCGAQVQTGQPTEEQPVQVQPAKAPRAPKQKKGGIRPLFIIISVIAVVLCIVIAVNASSLYGFGVKTFGGADAYFKYVEGKTIENAAKTLSTVYKNNNITDAMTDDAGVSANMQITMNDSMTDMLEDLIGMEDCSWLKSISLNTETNKKNNSIGMDAVLKLGKTDIVDLELAVDGTSEQITARLPELSDAYLSLDMSELGDESPELYEMIKDILAQEVEVPAYLQDTDKTADVLGKYVSLVVGNIEGVEKEKGSIKANGVKQDCTVLTLDVTYGMIYNILDDIYDEAEDDDELESILVECLDALAAMEGGYYTGEELYEELLNELDAAKEDILANEDPDEICLTLTDYVADHNIIGRELEADGAKIWYAYTRNGDEYGFEAEVDSVAFLSEGEIKSGKLTGIVSIREYNEEVMSFEINDLNLKELKKGFVNGNITVPLDEDMLNEMDLEMLTYMGGNAAVTLDLETGAKAGKAVLGIGLEDDEPLIAVIVDSKIHGAGKVSLPGGKAEVVSLNDEDDLLEWVTGLDFETILKNLEKAGLPEDLLSELETLVSYLALAGLY